MAHFRRPPFDPRLIAGQLEPFMRGPSATTKGEVMFGAAHPHLALAESIPMWRLEERKLAGAKSVGDAAVSMSRWHHQIVSNEQPVAYATSNEEQAARLTAVNYAADVARAVDDAIRMLDGRKEFGDDVEVRLLLVPSYHLTTLWLTGPGADEVVVLPRTTPEQAEQRLGIKELTQLHGEMFLGLLRKVGPIGGFVGKPEEKPEGKPEQT